MLSLSTCPTLLVCGLHVRGPKLVGTSGIILVPLLMTPVMQSQQGRSATLTCRCPVLLVSVSGVNR